jgi:uncharacterized protein (TIGR02246 family)
MNRRWTTVALLWLALASFAAPQHAAARAQAHCAPISETTVKNLFTTWSRALLEHTPDKVVALYGKDATLLPTVEVGPYMHDDIRKYFVHFLEKRPVATMDDHARVITLGCNVAYDIGLYSFELNGNPPTVRETVKARYTFIYKWDGREWKIAHHHSSKAP